MFKRLRLTAIFIATGAATVIGFQSSPSNRPWPPGLQKVSDDSPALSAVDELKTFYMPPGYHVDLVASEPLVQDPIAIDWDADGRLWVVEYPEYVRDLQAPEPNLDPIGRIVVLEDTNNDGKMDKRTVFAEGLIQARSVKALDHGILVLEPPNVWLMRDTNGDLKMDTKELVATGYGRREGGVEGNANGFFWGLDNWLHSAGTNIDFSLRLKDGRFDRRPTLSRGEWGVSQDDAGRMYRNSSESAIHADLVPTPYFARNPSLVRTRGSYEPLTNDQVNINTVWPVRPNPGTNRAYQFGVDRPDGTLGEFTAACTPLVYRGDRLPAELYGNVFVGEPAANFVSRLILSDDGKSLRARKAYENAEFLSSTDERFRPVFLSNAPDGTFTIVDFYRGVIQDRASTTVYLKDYITRKKLDQPIGVGMGRIFRVMHETTRRDVTPSLSKASPAQLVQTLSHPNGWRRDTAQRLLVERGDKSVTASLKTLASSATDPRARIHALWTLDGNDSIDVPTLQKALADSARDVRVSALRIAERWLGTADHPIAPMVMKLMDDGDWAVREQLGASLGTLPPDARDTAVAAFLDKAADDPVAVDAAVSGVRGAESIVLDKILRMSGGPTPARETAITALAATIVKAGQDATVQALLGWTTEENRPMWQRAAILRGAEVVLANVAMPGSGRRGIAVSTTTAAVSAAGAPCPTCPGGRAGPGGGYAFDDARGSVAPPAAGGTVVARGGRGSAGGGPRLRLNREPAAFAGMAAGQSELSTRATNVLSRLEWPGKPGAAAAVAPLTAEEQSRFTAGADVYKNVCQVCHQPDGRGLDRVAATLVGSPLALAAAADIPARIVMNGKEGPIGLMPPIGLTLSDDQIAAVLTYIRREWGQTGSPVDPATVKSVRTQYGSRTTPWKHEELMALVK
jgi:mono/diheme cytochrome c family protein/glucose/arabinose dehydrogenase